jgi:beta-lactamase class A
MISRRTLVGSALMLPTLAYAADPAAPVMALTALEQKTGARIGVAALDTGSGKGVFWRESERFVMCSTFKLSLAASLLAKVDKGAERLDRLVKYDKPVLGVSPETTKNWPHGMTIAQLCRAAIIYSDNTAANVLLRESGGPAALTRFWRSIGDASTRLDANEPALNDPDPVKNTTTPTAMMANLKVLTLGNTLSPASRTRLLGWMNANTTGADTLKAGLPRDWAIGDKTGRNPDAGFINDIAIVTPPPSSDGKARKPIFMVCYTAKADAKVVAAVGKILSDAFA